MKDLAKQQELLFRYQYQVQVDFDKEEVGRSHVICNGNWDNVGEIRKELEHIPDDATIEVEPDWDYDEYVGGKVIAHWSGTLTKEEREGLLAWTELNAWQKEQLKKKRKR